MRERERERERESKIKQLRKRIEKLEAIVNRTPQQVQELKDKKEELVKLETQINEKQPTNYLPWILGGIGIILLVGIIAYLLGKKQTKNRGYHGKN